MSETDFPLSEAARRMDAATTTADRLRAVLDFYRPRDENGWWPFDQDHPEYKRGASDTEGFWRYQIEKALELDGPEVQP